MSVVLLALALAASPVAVTPNVAFAAGHTRGRAGQDRD
jgi:hypothetical protein